VLIEMLKQARGQGVTAAPQERQPDQNRAADGQDAEPLVAARQVGHAAEDDGPRIAAFFPHSV